MRSWCVAGMLFLALCGLAREATAGNFSFRCPTSRYVSVPVGTGEYEFNVPISAVAPGADTVEVTLDSHVPDFWFAQFCQASTHVCYPTSGQIRLGVGVADTLQIGFFPDPTTIGMGYVNVTVRSIADRYDYAQCTFTLYNGMPIPTGVNYTVDCSDNTRFVTSGDEVTFKTPIRNRGAQNDSLHVQLVGDLPSGWYAQFCQTSTHVCFTDHATVYFPRSVPDTLEVDMFMYGIHGAGAADVDIYSALIPSFSQYCHYRVFEGSYPMSAPEGPAVSAVRSAWAAPNPFGGNTNLQLRLDVPAPVSLAIFGADGRLIRTFSPQAGRAGVNSLRWDGRDDHGSMVPAGAYFYRFQ